MYDCFLNSNDYEFKDHKQRISSYTKERQNIFPTEKILLPRPCNVKKFITYLQGTYSM